ncbi:hypothetical protein LINGRAHAP2_LOCUS11329 [Linum grandiflorum]
MEDLRFKSGPTRG